MRFGVYFWFKCRYRFLWQFFNLTDPEWLEIMWTKIAETEMSKMENDLKAKLLQIRNGE